MARHHFSRWLNGVFGTRQVGLRSCRGSTRHTTVRPGLAARVGYPHVEQLEDRTTPTMCLGFIDSAGPWDTDIAVQGWAFDPDNSGASVQIHMYVDGQSPPAVIATTDRYRPDVNAAYAIGGNHGYYIRVPTQFLDGNSHTVQVFAVDTNGDPNPSLGTRTVRDTPTVGYLDDITPDGVLKGWAKDPDVPDWSINVDVYAQEVTKDPPPPRMIGRYPANEARSDLPKPQAFSMQLPAQYLDRRAYKIFVYGLDVENPGSPNSGLVNSQLIGSPRLFTYATISGGDVAGRGPVSVHAGGQFAGAIDSIRWAGVEFINNDDHGRQAQAAFWGVPDRELSDADVVAYRNRGGSLFGLIPRYNPTEAGSRADEGPSKPSTSLLTSINSPQPNRLTTQATMAYWTHYPELIEGNPPPEWGGPMPAWRPETVSSYTIRKDVTVGADGMNNVILVRNTLKVPPEDMLDFYQYYSLILYHNRDLGGGKKLDRYYVYNPTSQGLEPIDPAPGDARPRALSTEDGAYAIALVSVQASGDRPLKSFTEGWDHLLNYDPLHPRQAKSDSTYGWLVSAYQAVTEDPARWGENRLGGEYQVDNYIIVGDRSTVEATLRRLQDQGLVTPPPNSAPSPVGLVRGTPGYDRITMRNIGGGVAEAVVESFSDPAMTNLVDTLKYDVPISGNGLRINGGGGSDLVVIANDLGTSVRAVGGTGADTFSLYNFPGYTTYSDRVQAGGTTVLLAEDGGGTVANVHLTGSGAVITVTGPLPATTVVAHGLTGTNNVLVMRGLPGGDTMTATPATSVTLANGSVTRAAPGYRPVYFDTGVQQVNFEAGVGGTTTVYTSPSTTTTFVVAGATGTYTGVVVRGADLAAGQVENLIAVPATSTTAPNGYVSLSGGYRSVLFTSNVQQVNIWAGAGGADGVYVYPSTTNVFAVAGRPGTGTTVAVIGPDQASTATQTLTATPAAPGANGWVATSIPGYQRVYFDVNVQVVNVQVGTGGTAVVDVAPSATTTFNVFGRAGTYTGVVVHGTAGNDTLLAAPAAGAALGSVALSAGTVNYRSVFFDANVQQVNIWAGDGDDTVRATPAASPSLNVFSVDGGLGFDRLIYNLSGVAGPRNDGSKITFDNRNPIYYSNVESVGGEYF